jgi:hypothetical protein
VFTAALVSAFCSSTRRPTGSRVRPFRWHGRYCREVDVTFEEAQAVLAALALLAGDKAKRGLCSGRTPQPPRARASVRGTCCLGASGPAHPYTRFAMKLVTGFLGLALGSLIGLIGLIRLFLILYQGDSATESDTYINVGGTKIDGDFVGIPLAIISVGVIAISLQSLRKRGVP